MESNTNTYKLEQAGKVYMLTTGIFGDNIRLSCRNSSSPQNKKYSRDFNIEQLHKVDKLFNVLKTPLQAVKYIDEALRQQKVGVTEENNGIKITFYITTKGITNQIDIPLGDINEFSSNGNEYLQQGENIQNYESVENNNYEQYLQNDAYTQENQIIGTENVDYNQYPVTTPGTLETNTKTNLYTTEQNIQTDTGFNMNQYFNDIKENTQEGPYISPADNEDANKYFQEYQTVENSAKTDINQYTTSNEYIEQIENNNINIDEQIKQFLQQSNTNDVNTNIITTQTEEKEINKESKPLTTTKVLPVKTTTRVLPPIGPFSTLDGLDLHKLGIMNSEHQRMPTFEQMIQSEIPIPQTETKINYYEESNQINTQPQIITAGSTKTKTTKTTITTNLANDFNLNADNLYFGENVDIPQSQVQITSDQTQLINNIQSENIMLKRQIEELRNSQSKMKNISFTQNQLNELQSLRRKAGELEILKSQLKELNALRMEVAEYHAVKDQLKELAILKEKITAQNKELDILRLKAKEADRLRLRVEELENLKNKYEKDILGLKESIRLYSIKTQIKEDKEAIEDDTPEEITVKGDIIHDINELELITKKINKNNQKLTLNLLYKATADTDNAAAFHAKCDDAKSSVVLIETKKGKRFGGFTTCSWSGDCDEKKDEEAFVFSLDKMKTYDSIPDEDAIGCYPKFGPIFLGCQIRIFNNAFTKGGTTYEKGLNYKTEEDFELTGGDRVFNVKEIEVYEVIKE